MAAPNNLLDYTSQSTPAIPDSVSDACASKSPATYRWDRVIELGYDESSDGRWGGNNATEDSLECEDPACFHCGKVGVATKLSRCARCQVASYW